MNINFVNHLYLFKLLLLNQNNPNWSLIDITWNAQKKTWFLKINKN